MTWNTTENLLRTQVTREDKTRQDIYKKSDTYQLQCPIARENIRGKLVGHSTNAIKNNTVISKMETTDQILQNTYWTVIAP
jgi:hypothetical protein